MKLTAYFDYSMRVLSYLGRRPGEWATITEIADYFEISRNHLIKIVHQLGVHEFIQTSRGKNGGIRLARSANLIWIGEVARKMEPNFDLLECFNLQTNQCALSRECGLKPILFEATRAFIGRLDQYTLADVLSAPEYASASVPRGRVIPIVPMKPRARTRA